MSMTLSKTTLKSQQTEQKKPGLKTNPYRMLITALIQSLKYVWADRSDFFTGGNMFVYFNPNQEFSRDYCELDFFVVLNTTKNEEREAWIVWEESERKPNIVIELLSKTTTSFDLEQKKQIYEQHLKVEDYFIFDPYAPYSLRGWHLFNQGYQELQPNDKGWLWSNSLGLWLGTWEGRLEQASRCWLRFYDQKGQLLLLPEEKVTTALQQAEQALQKATNAQQHNELAVRLAEKAAQKMEEAIQEAALELHQKEWALRQAQQAQQRADKLAKMLQAQGINVDEH